MSADAGGTGTGLKKAEITKYKTDKHGKNRVIFPGVEFTLEKKVDGSWVKVTAARTGDDGKVSFAALNPRPNTGSGRRAVMRDMNRQTMSISTFRRGILRRT